MASLDRILSFTAAARHQSFAGAARELGLTASAVAKNVSRWEAALGLRLFLRTTRQVTLSQDGRELYERCVRILEEVEGLEASAALARVELRGVLRIDAPAVYGRAVVLPQLLRLRERHPRLELDVRLSDRYSDLVRDGLDAAVRIGELTDSGLAARTFDRQWLVTCASPAYLSERGMPTVPERILDHDCLVFRHPSSGRDRPWQYRVDGRDIALQPRPRVRIDCGETLALAAQAGQGVVQVPHYMVQAAIDAGRLVELLRPFKPPSMPISMVYPANRHPPPRLRAAIDALVALNPAAGRAPP